jgi:hypothetical protein
MKFRDRGNEMSTLNKSSCGTEVVDVDKDPPAGEHGEEIERGISNCGGDDDKALLGC